eukprot:augustus_masked-scaffold_10-processed-gene-13.50-mRNA-1 protein AED:1.00 eAED:1.00 QI:0/-1/0/0/-1/1/1/0/253
MPTRRDTTDKYNRTKPNKQQNMQQIERRNFEEEQTELQSVPTLTAKVVHSPPKFHLPRLLHKKSKRPSGDFNESGQLTQNCSDEGNSSDQNSIQIEIPDAEPVGKRKSHFFALLKNLPHARSSPRKRTTHQNTSSNSSQNQVYNSIVQDYVSCEENEFILSSLSPEERQRIEFEAGSQREPTLPTVIVHRPISLPLDDRVEETQPEEDDDWELFHRFMPDTTRNETETDEHRQTPPRRNTSRNFHNAFRNLAV